MEIFLRADSVLSELQSGRLTQVSRDNRACRASRGLGAEASVVVGGVVIRPHQGFGFWIPDGQLLDLQGNTWPRAPPVPSARGKEPTAGATPALLTGWLASEVTSCPTGRARVLQSPGRGAGRSWQGWGGAGDIPEEARPRAETGSAPRPGQGFGGSLNPAPAPGQREGYTSPGDCTGAKTKLKKQHEIEQESKFCIRGKNYATTAQEALTPEDVQ